LILSPVLSSLSIVLVSLLDREQWKRQRHVIEYLMLLNKRKSMLHQNLLLVRLQADLLISEVDLLVRLQCAVFDRRLLRLHDLCLGVVERALDRRA
jgi:hypothetical protein